MLDKLILKMESDKPFDQLVDDLQTQVAEHGFRVLAVHDVQETLAEKGFERGPLKIVEVCNAKFAHEATQREIGVAVLMPCRFTVHIEGDKSLLTLARPAMMSEMLPEAGLEDIAGQVEKILTSVMDATV
jgi:uncharacterized protein (DUF302 family)